MNDHRFDHDKTSNFVDVTKIKVDAEKAIATKEKTKEKKKDKKSTIYRTKKIKTIKKTAISNRNRKRNKISNEKKKMKIMFLRNHLRMIVMRIV